VKGTVYACPACGDRIELFIPTKGAWCSNKHASVAMQPVTQKARPVGRATAYSSE
jgi:hypothetical protein